MTTFRELKESLVILLTRLLDSKSKKWALISILIFLFLSLDDYSVAALRIPPLNQLNVNEGVVQIKRKIAGRNGARDVVYLLEARKAIEFNCRISSRDNGSCIAMGNPEFYDKKIVSESWFGKKVIIKPNTSKKARHARVWWYEASIFGPLKEKRLLQLDVEGERIVGYDQQKAKYMSKKSKHGYMPTILLAISLISFFLLQLANRPKWAGSKT